MAALVPLGAGRGGGSVAVAASGSLLLPRSSGLAVFDLSRGSEQILYNSGQVVLGATWSPDGGRVAFCQFAKVSGDYYGGTDIYLLDGKQPTAIVQHTPPDQFLGAPIWSSDGQSLVYELAGGRAGNTIERAAPDGTARQTLVRTARAPTMSPDGSRMAFIRSTNVESLVIQPAAGGAEQVLLPPDLFVGISAPRFSPDGQQLAFMGIGGPSGLRLPAPADPLASLKLGPTAALAHGIPWDPWVVKADGSGLRQVASLAEDDPTIAWSPDSSTLAALGGGGLWLMQVDGSASPSLIGNGSYGLLDWRP